jgi:hypothetical protein
MRSKILDIFLENRLSSEIWYHGDIHRRSGFCDQRMDRELYVQESNANGPGIYLTRNKEEAKTYCGDRGYVYTLKILGDRIIEDKERSNSRKSQDFLYRLIKEGQRYNSERVYYGISDYIEVRSESEVMDYHIRKIVLEVFSRISFIESCINIGKEFYSNANDWCSVMSSLGIVGYHPSNTEHLVIYDCNSIEIVSEESIEEVTGEI